MSAGHDHHHSRDRLGFALLLNVSFTLIELFGAWWTNSTAIAADAVHDLGDSLALAFAWVLQGLSEKERTPRFTFGYRRLSLLAALVNASVLVAGGAFVLAEAAPRVLDPEPSDATGMIALAVLGILVNGAAVLRLRGGGAGLNEKVVTWHLLEDVFGWIAVLIVAACMLVVDAPILDPLLAVLLTAVVVSQALRHLVATARIFLQATPPDLSVDRIRQTLRQVDGVLATHHVHVWSQDGEHHVLTARLQVREGTTLAQACDIREVAREVLREDGVDHATLEVSTAPEEAPHCGA